MPTIKLEKEDVYEAVEDCIQIATESWRWGTKETYVFQHSDGKFYRFTVQMHSSEGLQIFGSITATEVTEVAKVCKVWEDVPDPTEVEP